MIDQLLNTTYMKMIFSTLTIALCCIVGCSQPGDKVNVPEVVKTKFISMYPHVGTPRWEMEDGKYEATFKQDNMETSVILTPEGNVDQTETEMDIALLPQPIKDYVSSQPGGKKISSAAKIVNANGTITFETEVDKTDYLFDESGQFMSKEDQENGGDEDKD